MEAKLHLWSVYIADNHGHSINEYSENEIVVHVGIILNRTESDVVPSENSAVSTVGDSYCEVIGIDCCVELSVTLGIYGLSTSPTIMDTPSTNTAKTKLSSMSGSS